MVKIIAWSIIGFLAGYAFADDIDAFINRYIRRKK